MANNENTAVQVSKKFHEDVKRVSKRKLQGDVVKSFQARFAPIMGFRVAKSGENGVVVVGRVKLPPLKHTKLAAKKKK